MRNVFDVYMFPSKMNTSQDIRQKLEKSLIVGASHPSRGKSTGQFVVDFQYVHQGAIPNNFTEKKICTNYVQEGFFVKLICWTTTLSTKIVTFSHKKP